MDSATLVPTTKTEDLIAMNGAELEAWFAAGGLPVELVANCGDPECRDCTTVEPIRAA